MGHFYKSRNPKKLTFVFRKLGAKRMSLVTWLSSGSANSVLTSTTKESFAARSVNTFVCSYQILLSLISLCENDATSLGAPSGVSVRIRPSTGGVLIVSVMWRGGWLGSEVRASKCFGPIPWRRSGKTCSREFRANDSDSFLTVTLTQY
jgi:hypothetical protein